MSGHPTAERATASSAGSRGIARRAPRDRACRATSGFRATTGTPARSTPEARLELLAERLEHYEVDVLSRRTGDAARTIAAALAARGKRRIIVPADIAPAWLPGGIRIRAGRRPVLRRAGSLRRRAHRLRRGDRADRDDRAEPRRRRGPARADPDPRLPPVRGPRRAGRRDGAGRRFAAWRRAGRRWSRRSPVRRRPRTSR